MKDKKFISMEELFPIFENLKDDELIVDVRTGEEFSDGRVPNSDHIPFELIAEKAEQYKEYSKVYLYCRSGMRSQSAYSILENAGLDNLVCINDGGMIRWMEAGYPVES